MNGKIVHGLLAACLLGCGSLPKAPDLASAPGLRGDLSAKKIHLPACAENLPEEAGRYCRTRLGDTYRALVSTELFREVAIGEDPSGAGDLVVDLHDFPRRPYSTTPGHNPGFLLLSLAIPFWWSEPLGFRFSVRELPEGERVLIDTRWEGTVVMWSLASLLNIAPSRTFVSTFDQDVVRLREALTGRPAGSGGT
jgi:hypothetical protein